MHTIRLRVNNTIYNNLMWLLNKFKKDILTVITDIPLMPYKHRKSIYFNSENISDLIFKGSTIVYRINPDKKEIEIFGLIKHEEHL